MFTMWSGPARDHRVPLSTGGVDLAGLLPLVPAGVPLVWELSPSQRSAQIVEALGKWRAGFGNATGPVSRARVQPTGA